MPANAEAFRMAASQAHDHRCNPAAHATQHPQRNDQDRGRDADPHERTQEGIEIATLARLLDGTAQFARRALNIAGRSAQIAVVVPYALGDLGGVVLGQFLQTSRSEGLARRSIPSVFRTPTYGAEDWERSIMMRISRGLPLAVCPLVLGPS